MHIVSKSLQLAAAALLGLASLAAAAPGDLAVYFGSFDPLHEGHLAVVRGALPDLGVDRVLVIPTPSSRKETASLQDRLAMVRAVAFRYKELSAPGPELAKLLREGGKEWKAKVYAHLYDQLERGAMVQEIMGMDRFHAILDAGMVPPGREPRMLIVVDRPGYPLDVGLLRKKDVPGKVLFLHPDVVDVQSSVVRRKIRNGQDVFGLLPNVVRKLIEARKLYR